MIKSLLDARMTDVLPRILAGQDWVIALSESLGLAFARTLSYADRSQIYTKIDQAPEAYLDALAVNWKIDWYDTSLPLEQKRKTVKTALTVRRLMGTAKAVKLQAEAVWPGAEIEEWFQYGGEAGRFRVRVDLPDTGMSSDDYRLLIRGIELTKNVRCHLEAVNVRRETTAELSVGGFAVAKQTVEVWPELTTFVETAVGAKTCGVTAAGVRIEIYPVGGE